MAKKRTTRRTGPVPKPASEIQSERVPLRVRPDEKRALEQAADENQVTVTEFIRRWIRRDLIGEP